MAEKNTTLQDLNDTVAQLDAAAAEMRRLKGVNLCDSCTMPPECEGAEAQENGHGVYFCGVYVQTDPDGGPTGPAACDSCGQMGAHGCPQDDPPAPGHYCPDYFDGEAARDQDRDQKIDLRAGR